MSKLGFEPSIAPRWTPPIPPVAKTRIPAAWQAIIVAATVVAPHAAAGDRGAQVPPRDLVDRAPLGRRQAFELVAGQPDQELALVQRDRGRDRAGRPDRRLGCGRDLDVLGVRQPVADERGLEGDDGAAVPQRVGDLWGDGEMLGADHAPRVRQGRVRQEASVP